MMFPSSECLTMLARNLGSVKACSPNVSQTGLRTLDHCGLRGHHLRMLIFKIFRDAEWADLRAQGTTKGAPIDLADGYIHFSTAQQAAETAVKHFAGVADLMLLAVNTETLGDDLKWEVSRGDALFPHLYRDLSMADVVWAQPLPLMDGTHVFPAGLDEAAS